MTAPTPEQMRALSDALTAEADYYESDVDCLENRSAAALRAAADQIEAAERWQERVRWNSSDIADEADAFCAADTAPQESEQWTTTTEYAYGTLDAPDIIVPTGEDIDDLGTARYNAEEFWIDALQRTVKRGPWSVVPAPQEDRDE